MSQSYPYAQPPLRKRRPVVFFLLLFTLLFTVVLLGFFIQNTLDRRGIFTGPRLGMVRIEGFIANADSVVAWTETLRSDPSVAGVLVRIDSPGGAVAPSQEMHAAVKRLAGEKPVVVSMGAVAASGGYYIATAGREIFANPSTITGSIGVRLQLANVRGLLERLGISAENLTTGPLKAAGSPFDPLTDEQRAYLNTLLHDMQREFVATVAEGRNLPEGAVTPYADGRMLTGRQALAAKLVDHIGSQQEAVERLKALCTLQGTPTMLEGPEKKEPWWKFFILSLMDLDAARSTEAGRFLFLY